MKCAYASDAPSMISATTPITATVLGASLAPADDRSRSQHDGAVEVPNQLSTEADHAQNVGGVGLGLYITRELVEAHRGEITVSSDALTGTTFAVKLPK